MRIEGLKTSSNPADNNRIFLIKVIAAEGEQKASRALKEAATVINESPSALQVSCLVPKVF